jgi:putative hydrolase of the HAD superfamily
MQPDRDIQGVLFDLDNTLVRYIDAHRSACAAVAELVAGSEDTLFSFFLRPVHGFESPDHIRDYLNSIGSDEAFERASAVYDEAKLGAIAPYDGVVVTLQRLVEAGIPMGIVTNADEDHARARMRRCGLQGFFDIVVTPDLTGERKPSSTNFYRALDLLGIEPISAAMVGDSIRRDIEPANRIGMLSIHAAYGNWQPAETSVPDWSIDTIGDLVPIILRERERNLF